MISSLTVTLTMKIANQSFKKTIWLITMHHHTKFGRKRFCKAKNIIWTNHSLTFQNSAVTLTENKRMMAGYHPKKILYCCEPLQSWSLVNFSDSAYAGHYLLCPMLMMLLAKPLNEAESVMPFREQTTMTFLC